MGKMAKMVPVPGMGILYILDIDDRKISYKFQYYNSRVFFKDWVDITEDNRGILISLFSDTQVIIPLSSEELRKEFSNETASNYFS